MYSTRARSRLYRHADVSSARFNGWTSGYSCVTYHSRCGEIRELITRVFVESQRKDTEGELGPTHDTL